MSRESTHPANTVHYDAWDVSLVAIALVAVLIGGVVYFTSLSQAQLFDAVAVITGILGVAAVAGILVRHRSLAPSTRLGYSWLAFMVWALFAAVLSHRSLAAFVGEPTSMLGFWTMAALAAAAGAASLRARGLRELLRMVAPWVLLVEIVATALFVWLSSRAGPIDMGVVAGGTLFNSTALGELTVLLLPWVPSVLPWERDARPAILLRAFISVAAIVTLLFAGARAALLVAALWALWVMLHARSVSANLRKIVFGAAAAAVVLGVCIYVVSGLQVAGVGGLGFRPELTRTAVRAAIVSPLVGYGPDGFVAGGALVSTPAFVSKSAPIVFDPGATDPHNAILWIAVSTGLVGLGLFVWTGVETVLAWRSRYREGLDVSPGAWAIVGCFVVYLTAPAYLATLPFFALAYGASLPTRSPSEPRGSARIGGLAIALALGLSAVLLAANAMTRLPLEQDSAATAKTLAPLSQTAMRVWRFDPHLAYLASLQTAWLAAPNPSAAQAGPDLDAIERAAELDTRDPFIGLEVARTMEFYGLPQGRVDAAYEAALARWPFNPSARLEFASYLHDTKRDAEARVELQPLVGVNLTSYTFPSDLANVAKELGVQLMLN